VTPAWPPELAALCFASVRLVALFGVAPFFGHALVPPRIRVALAFGVALVVAPVLPPGAAGPGDEPFAVAGAALGELLSGLTLGFAVRLLFVALDVIGELASIQGGLGAAQTLDPASQSHSPALGSLLGVLALGTWLAIGGHHDLLRAVVASYDVLPLGGGGPGADSFLAVASLAAPMLALGVQLAAPVTAAMLLANTAVGVLGRAIPQLNLITLQLPAHVAITLLVLALGARGLVDVLQGEMDGWTGRAVAALAGEG
jgi:flagellar biosynthetic protein FliR